MRRLTLLLTLLLSLAAFGVATAQDDDPLPGRIAFSSDRDGIYQIYVANADGSDARQISHSPDVAYLPLWSPDGGKLLYLESIGEAGSDGRPVLRLMLANADGSDPIELSRDPEGGFVMNPATYLRWSPDGERLVYGLFTDDENGQHVRFYVDALDGSAPVEVVSPVIGEDIGYAQFLDNETLLLTAGIAVYRASLDGSEPELVIELAGVPVVLSPDRQRIASISAGELMLYDADGSNPVVVMEEMPGPVPDTYVAFAYDLIWSPDGEWLSGTARLLEPLTIDGTPDPTPETPLPQQALFTVRADGSDYTSFVAADLILSWSPDSSHIAYTVPQGDGVAVAVASPDGSDPLVFSGEGSSAQPAWQP